MSSAPNLENLTGFTLDDIRTRDMDDALTVVDHEDGWRVCVSIANAAFSIEPDSEQDLAARSRVATRYFATGNSPMLPRELSDGTLSLWPGSSKRVLVIEITFSGQVEVLGVRFYPGLLRSLAKLAYQEVPGILKAPEHPQHKAITTLSNIAKVILDRRRDAGALALYDINNGWVTTEEGFLRQLKSHEDTIGHILIQEFMVLANSLVAQEMVKEDVPFLFRNHTARSAAPDRGELMRTLDEALRGGVISNLNTLRERTHMLLDKADYGPTLKGHYGLNLPAYCHFTSPIRRYADLLNHQQFRSWLRKEPLPYTKEKVEEIALHINKVNLAEVVSKSAHMKAKAEEKVKNPMYARQVDGLNAKDFERFVKVQARLNATVDNPQDADEVLVENFAKRLIDDRMPVVCMMTAFIEPSETPNWGKIQKLLLDHMTAKPELAISILTMASQQHNWTTTFNMTDSGPAHLKQFTVTAKLTDGVDTYEVQYTGSPKKLAEQRAAVLLLVRAVAMEAPSFPEGKAPPPPALQATPTKKVSYDGTKDAVAFINELAQSRGEPLPAFEVVVSGPPHIPTMTCTVTFEGKTSKGTAGNKQDAKRTAAKALIEQLDL